METYLQAFLSSVSDRDNQLPTLVTLTSGKKTPGGWVGSWDKTLWIKKNNLLLLPGIEASMQPSHYTESLHSVYTFIQPYTKNQTFVKKADFFLLYYWVFGVFDTELVGV